MRLGAQCGFYTWGDLGTHAALLVADPGRSEAPERMLVEVAAGS